MDVRCGSARPREKENAYHTRLTKDDEGMKISETWVLAEYGYKDWKEE